MVIKNTMLLESIETIRIKGTLTCESDKNKIQEILDDNFNLIKLIGEKVDNEKEASSLARHTDLPPNGLTENLRNLLIIEKNTNAHIGILGCYLGYPKKDIFYIGTFFLMKSYQGKGSLLVVFQRDD